MKHKVLSNLSIMTIVAACSPSPHSTMVRRGLGGPLKTNEFQQAAQDPAGCLNVKTLLDQFRSDDTKSGGSDDASNPALVATTDFDVGGAGQDLRNFKAIGTDDTSRAIRANLLFGKTSPFLAVYSDGVTSDVVTSLSQSSFDPFDINFQKGCAPTTTTTPTRTTTPGITPTQPVVPVQGKIGVNGDNNQYDIIQSRSDFVTFKDGKGRLREYRLTSGGLQITTYTQVPSAVCGGNTGYTVKESLLLLSGSNMQLLPMKQTLLNLFSFYKLPVATVQTGQTGKKNSVYVLPASYPSVLKMIAGGKLDLTCPKN